MSYKHNTAFQVEALGIEYLDGLYSYALILARNPAEAADLVQETYVRAMQAADRLREDSNIKGWLFTILRNVWLNQVRKRRTGPQMVEVDDDSGASADVTKASKDSYETYVNNLERDQVRAAIQKLPVDLREVILLREYEELSYGEIAGVLHCPAGTVMSRLGRARSKLRALLLQR
jgi:RNA polymerase sigma-70 factor, ECF subfamily